MLIVHFQFAIGFERLNGKLCLFPFGLHCTGMPIKVNIAGHGNSRMLGYSRIGCYNGTPTTARKCGLSRQVVSDDRFSSIELWVFTLENCGFQYRFHCTYLQV